jgi:hypothetical protein
MSESRFQYSFQTHFPTNPKFERSLRQKITSKIPENLTGQATDRSHESIGISAIFRGGRCDYSIR